MITLIRTYIKAIHERTLRIVSLTWLAGIILTESINNAVALYTTNGRAFLITVHCQVNYIRGSDIASIVFVLIDILLSRV